MTGGYVFTGVCLLTQGVPNLHHIIFSTTGFMSFLEGTPVNGPRFLSAGTPVPGVGRGIPGTGVLEYPPPRWDWCVPVVVFRRRTSCFVDFLQKKINIISASDPGLTCIESTSNDDNDFGNIGGGRTNNPDVSDHLLRAVGTNTGLDGQYRSNTYPIRRIFGQYH